MNIPLYIRVNDDNDHECDITCPFFGGGYCHLHSLDLRETGEEDQHGNKYYERSYLCLDIYPQDAD